MKTGTKKVKDNGEMHYKVPTREEFAAWLNDPEKHEAHLTNLEKLVEQQLVQHQLSSRFRTDVANSVDAEKTKEEQNECLKRIASTYSFDFSKVGATRTSKWGSLKPYVDIAKAKLKSEGKELTDDAIRDVASQAKEKLESLGL